VGWYWRWLLSAIAAIATTAVIGLAIVFLTVEPPPSDDPGPSVDPVPGVVDFVAVYHVDELPEPERMAFIEAAGLDVFQAVASCWAGLPERLGIPPDRLVLGVWAPSQDKLDAAIDRVPGEPMLTAELVHVCPTD
jgi:hypothetical protein